MHRNPRQNQRRDKEELNLTDFQLKFNLEWLIANGFVVEKDGKLRLTEDGIELLEAG